MPTTVHPRSHLLNYADFTVRIAESDFMHDPTGTTRAALGEAAARLVQLRANLAAARDALLLAFGTAPQPANMTVARGADLALLELGRTVCPRSPSTLRACTGTGDDAAPTQPALES